MTQDKLNEITDLKNEIEKLKRVLKADNHFYIGNPEQNTHDYYMIDGELYRQIKSMLEFKLGYLENHFKEA